MTSAFDLIVTLPEFTFKLDRIARDLADGYGVIWILPKHVWVGTLVSALSQLLGDSCLRGCRSRRPRQSLSHCWRQLLQVRRPREQEIYSLQGEEDSSCRDPILPHLQRHHRSHGRICPQATIWGAKAAVHGVKNSTAISCVTICLISAHERPIRRSATYRAWSSWISRKNRKYSIDPAARKKRNAMNIAMSIAICMLPLMRVCLDPG